MKALISAAIGAIFGPHCKHYYVRCVHGDEVLWIRARVACLDCGKPLPKEQMPLRCWVAGGWHTPREAT